ERVPGQTMPKLVVVERDYTKIAEKWSALGPLTDRLGMVTKSVAFDPTPEVAELAVLNGLVAGTGVGAGRPRLETAQQACEMILALSGTTNGRLAVQGFKDIEKRTGTR